MTSIDSSYSDQNPSPVYLDIDGCHRAMLAGQLSCVQLVDSMLARIAQWDRQGPALKALLAIHPQARELAMEKDRALARGGLTGPLHGIPVVVKDNGNTTDMPTTAGSLSLQGFIPKANSTAVQKLLEAGAIILAKSNLHEFALGGMTISSLGGPTLNPYDLTRTCGGSSGGSAAALAMGFCTVALGTDTVNSIRSPASAANLVGLRPTRGLVSRAGWVPVAETQDAVGPMGRTVSDVAKVLDALAGYDSADPITAYSVGRMPASYSEPLGSIQLDGRRFGVLTSFFGRDAIHEAVNVAMDDVRQVLSRAGAVCVDLNDVSLDADTLIQEADVQKWEFETLLNDYLANEPSAPVSSLAEILASGQYHACLDDFFQQAVGMKQPFEDINYLQRKLEHQHLRDRLLALMAEHALDALIYPLQKRLVVSTDYASQVDRNGILAALTGLPALNLPAGFSPPDDHAPRGVPIGFDMLGRPFDEPLLLGLGHAYEQLTDLKRLPDTQAWPAFPG